MASEPRQPSSEPVGLSPEAYLIELRTTLQRESRGSAIRDTRELTDMWTFEGIDAFEPLTNEGRSNIQWEYPEWHSISGDLTTQLSATVEGEDWAVPLNEMPADLACYIGYVVLELNAHHDPLYDLINQAIVLPIIVAAKKRIEPVLFRRYLIGLFDRRHSFDETALNYTTLIQATALGAALGSADDAVIGHRVVEIRDWLEHRATSAEGRFRDFVDARFRPLWIDAAPASANDAAGWAGTYMK